MTAKTNSDPYFTLYSYYYQPASVQVTYSAPALAIEPKHPRLTFKELAEARKALNKKLNYWVDYRVLRAGDFGIPQNRERIFIVAFNKDKFSNINFDEAFSWPKPTNIKTCVGDILEAHKDVDPKYTISEKLLEGHERRKIQHIAKGNGFGFSVFKPTDEYTNTLSARYYKDGSEILIDQSKHNKRPRKLTPRECARLQGFPENFIVNAVSDVQIYKQFGNSVTVSVVEAVAKSVKKTLERLKQQELFF